MDPIQNVLELEALWAPLSRRRSRRVIVDWIGNRWTAGSFPALPDPGGWADPVLPWDGDGFRAGAGEWAGFAMAVHLARATGTTSMVELGASQAPWCLSWIRALTALGCHREPEPIRAVAIEAGPGTVAARQFWEDQKLGNSTTAEGEDLRFVGEGWEVEWRRRAVVAGGGTVYFPRVDITQDNGGRAVVEPGATDYRGYALEHDEVTGIDLVDLVDELGSLALVHADLQGAEAELMARGSFDVLQGNCSVLLLGTHSRAVEQATLERFPALGFTLLAETPCELIPGPDGLVLRTDGEQLWVAEDALALATSLGLILGTRVAQSEPIIDADKDTSTLTPHVTASALPRRWRWRRTHFSDPSS